MANENAQPVPIVTNPSMRYCSKCRKTLALTNFYTYKDGTKMELCKACLTMHVNNFEPETFLWILKDLDLPYVEEEWNVLRDRAYQKDPYKMNGMSVIGRYISKMKLKQWKDYGWADTEKIKEERVEKAKLYGTPQEEMDQKLADMKQAFENGEITEAQYETYAGINAPPTPPPQPEPAAAGQWSPYPENGGGFEQVELVDVGADLTQEDKVYLAMKWGRLYRADQWVALEQLYNEFMNSFDIQGAARIDTLKMICKTSLKMNEAIDAGDVDSYQKLSRVYDSMMKSAKFTEAQNKEGKSDFVNSIGEMVAYCEKEGGQIPKHKIDVPYDIVDKIIDDLKRYNKSLIYEDKSLAEEIENYLKNKQIAEDMKRDREEARLNGLDTVELKDEDFADFKENIAQQKAEDEARDAEEE